jgi:ketosteroid isomerase-like protein
VVSKGWRTATILLVCLFVPLLFAAQVVRYYWIVDQSTAARNGTKGILAQQEEAWNKGDLDGFMAHYRMSDETTMYSGGNVRQGWTTIMDNYRKHYQGDGKAMGELAFTDVQVEPLSADCCLARGKWAAKMPDGKTPHGLFTLLVKKTPEGWKIVHDHTSVPDPKKE